MAFGLEKLHTKLTSTRWFVLKTNNYNMLHIYHDVFTLDIHDSFMFNFSVFKLAYFF